MDQNRALADALDLRQLPRTLDGANQADITICDASDHVLFVLNYLDHRKPEGYVGGNDCVRVDLPFELASQPMCVFISTDIIHFRLEQLSQLVGILFELPQDLELRAFNDTHCSFRPVAQQFLTSRQFQSELVKFIVEYPDTDDDRLMSFLRECDKLPTEENWQEIVEPICDALCQVQLDRAQCIAWLKSIRHNIVKVTLCSTGKTRAKEFRTWVVGKFVEVFDSLEIYFKSKGHLRDLFVEIIENITSNTMMKDLTQNTISLLVLKKKKKKIAAPKRKRVVEVAVEDVVDEEEEEDDVVILPPSSPSPLPPSSPPMEKKARVEFVFSPVKSKLFFDTYNKLSNVNQRHMRDLYFDDEPPVLAEKHDGIFQEMMDHMADLLDHTQREKLAEIDHGEEANAILRQSLENIQMSDVEDNDDDDDEELEVDLDISDPFRFTEQLRGFWVQRNALFDEHIRQCAETREQLQHQFDTLQQHLQNIQEQMDANAAKEAELRKARDIPLQ